MATTNLFSQPVFKEGAFTANDPAVRRYAVAKTLRRHRPRGRARRTVFVMWGGREGIECDAGEGRSWPRSTATREAVDLCCAYIRERGYQLVFALEPEAERTAGRHVPARPSATRWPSSTSSSGRTWWGSTPSSRTRRCRGSTSPTRVAQALWQGKLFHIDLNAQRIGKFDQDFRFGSEGIRDAFYLVKLLEDAAWAGMRHFDAHAYRTEDAEGVWDFALGLHAHLPDPGREGARGSARMPRSRRRWRVAQAAGLSEPTSPAGLGRDALDAFKAGTYDVEALAAEGYGNERLDQLVTELLLGVR